MSDSERWVAIPGWEGLYEVSNRGRVRSCDRVVVNWRKNRTGRRREIRSVWRGRILRQARKRRAHHIGTAGENYYAVVTLIDHNSHRRWCGPVAHLVLEGFVGPRPYGLVCCHTDDDGMNNDLSNLRWDTSAGNTADAYRNGRHNFLAANRGKAKWR